MTRISFLGWEFECDVAATREAYRDSTGVTDRCGCEHCRKFAAVRHEVLPGAVVQLYQELGINPEVEAEVYHIGETDAGRQVYAGWHHFIGSVVTDPGGPQQINERCSIDFVTKAHLAPAPFSGRQLVQVEFLVELPGFTPQPSPANRASSTMLLQKADLEFDPPLATFYEERKDSPLTVLSGSNNSGKSLVLKWLKATIGRSSYMIAANRFYHVYHISTGLRDPEQEHSNWENQFQSNFWQEQYNHEQNYISLDQLISGLNDRKRETLFKLCGELIGATFSLKRVQEDNELSVHYVDMDGQNLSVGSTGTRLLMTMLGICMDERFSTVLVDEPELGLSPRVQQAFSGFLQDTGARREYFPHLARVILATHSHLFLNRRDIQSNFVVAKAGKRITIAPTRAVADFHRLQFNLLGNTFESLFLPSAIVIVEGKTDFRYIERVLQLRFPDKKITVVQANGDGEIKHRVHVLKTLFGDLTSSPFRSRLFVVLDATHGVGRVQELMNLGVQRTNIVVWPRNGIEYYYPQDIVAEIFSCDPGRIGDLSMIGDVLELNGIQLKKDLLAERVTARLTPSTDFPEELESQLLRLLSAAVE